MPASGTSFREALARRTLVLDGATGTELERRGVASPLPLWSAGALIRHPHVVEAIHRDYVAAGADVVVANTFRTNLRTLRAAGRAEQGEALNRLAVELARRAASPPSEGPRLETGATGRQVWIAASVAPVEDCYHPERVPDEPTLQREHAQMMTWLRTADPDLVWIETMNTVREVGAAAQAAAAVGLPFAVSFVVRESSDLPSGEALEQAVAAIEPFDPLAVGLNCIPPRAVAGLLHRLRRITTRPLSAYAHIGNAEPIRGWTYSQDLSPAEYAGCARRWLDEGASIIGGCCGTTPAHIRALNALLGQVEGPR